jgi:hypothetical protein
MTQVYLVSPALVRKTEELLARVRRGPASEEYIHDWIARVDASTAGLQPAAGSASAYANASVMAAGFARKRASSR